MTYQPTKYSGFVREFFIFLLLFSSALTWLPRTCPGQRFRRSASELEVIRECDVIEGNLIIELIQEPEENWLIHGNLTIKEITGFLIFYDIQNIRSLDVIFPNLRVIRGETLFDGEYALVIYLLSDLEEINLPRLTTILQGSVFIYRNIALSYLSTVNFELIVNSDVHRNYIQSDRVKPCNANCTEGYCWTYNNCQNMCSNCLVGLGSKNDGGKTCHEQCVGGCYKPNDSTSCVACKNFRYHKSCLKRCGTGTFELDGYKCVTDTGCKDQHRFIYSKKCVKQCPWNYQITKLNSSDAIPTCNISATSIPCEGGMISSLRTSERFHGCKKINGSLQISLFGSAIDNIDKINQNLGQIDEIDGYVNIFDSSVRSLKFLNNLAVIHGQELLENRYSFVVTDCKNLLSLWEPRDNFVVEKGEVQFYRNPKLCPETIENLLGTEAYSKRFLPEQNDLKYILNGFKVSCRRKRIVVKTEALNMKGVIRLALPKVGKDPKDSKNLVGYLIYYKEAPKNIKFRGKQDIDDSWNRQFVPYNNEAGRILWTEIENLKPATRYAFFVITDTVPSAVSYQTEIFYSSTKRYNPSIPMHMNFRQKGKFIILSWDPPTNPNGHIDFYHVRIIPREASLPDASKQYCNNKIIGSDQNVSKDVKTSGKGGQTSRPSPTQENYQSKIEIEQLEIDLTNFIYYKQPSGIRKFKRSLTTYTGKVNDTSAVLFDPSTDKDDRYGDIFGLGPHEQVNVTPELLKSLLEMEDSLQPHTKDFEQNAPAMLKQIDALLANERTIGDSSKAPSISCSHKLGSGHQVIGNEFTTGPLNNSRYVIEVRACHNMTEDRINNPILASRVDSCWLCSAPIERELCILYPGANVRVQNVSAELLNSTAILIRWEPPNLPIKAEEVFSYNILLERNSSHNPFVTVTSYCATAAEREKILAIKYSGTYSVQVAAKLHCELGNQTFSDAISVHVADNTGSSTEWNIYLPVIIGFCFLSIFIGLIIWRIHKMDGKKNFEILKNLKYGTSRPIWNYYFEKAKLPAEVLHSGKNLKLEERLGEGHFGLVQRGSLITKDGILQVAAKQLKEVGQSSSELCEMLINEAKIMLQLRSHYLVQTYGLVSSRSDLFLVMELMSNGALSAFLDLRRRGDYQNTHIGSEDHLLRIAIQISDGMFYLENKSIIHRDLAARNCLLDENFNAKISDFGMSRIVNEGIYRIRSDQKVPLRRMPPEYFSRREFTGKSDVWCYGILLWELSIDKNTAPYEHLRDNEMEDEIKRGLTLSNSLPLSTPAYFSTLMNQCWKKDPKERPQFNHITSTLLAHSKHFILEEFKAKSYTYCGDIEEEQVYSAMTYNGGLAGAKGNDTELTVETPLTDNPNSEPTVIQHNETSKERSNLTLREKTRARMILIKQSIFFSKIFPFTLGSMPDGNMRKNSSRKDSFMRVL